MNLYYLAKLLDRANNSGNYLNQAVVEEMLIDTTNNLGLLKHIEDIELNNSISSIACYDSISKKIYFNWDSVSKMIFDSYQVIENRINLPYHAYYNYRIMEILFHEIRHAIQKQLINREIECEYVISQLLKDCILNSEHKIVVYNNDHELFPSEKDARIFALKTIIDIMEKCNSIDNNILMQLNHLLYIELLKDYDFDNLRYNKLKVFYETVFQNLDRYNEMEKKFKRLSLYDRMSFNMPIYDKDVILLAKITIKGKKSQGIKVLSKKMFK